MILPPLPAIKIEIDEFPYAETEHYRVTPDFLANPGKMLRILMADD